MKYTDYLKSEHWQALRKCQIIRAGGKCAICGSSPGILHIHHRHYFDEKGEYLFFKEQNDDLIVLCPEHHAKLHVVLDELTVACELGLFLHDEDAGSDRENEERYKWFDEIHSKASRDHTWPSFRMRANIPYCFKDRMCSLFSIAYARLGIEFDYNLAFSLFDDWITDYYRKALFQPSKFIRDLFKKD